MPYSNRNFQFIIDASRSLMISMSPVYRCNCVTPGLPEYQSESLHSYEEVTDPVDDEHYVMSDGPKSTYARQQFPDLLQSSVGPIGYSFNHPDCNRVALIRPR